MATIIGIDCATKDKKVGLALGRLSKGCAEVTEVMSNLKPGSVSTTLRSWVDPDGPTLLAIDAPLGWPQAMGRALADHNAGQPISVEPNRLFRRYTDLYVKERLSQNPLDVGADRIARTAHRALQLIADLGSALETQIDLAWEPALQGVQAIEVYPAATLRSYEILARQYKGEETGANARNTIVGELVKHVRLSREQLKLECIANDHALDAVVCVLAGADFLAGRAEGPAKQDAIVVRKEGWIWCRALGASTPNTGPQADGYRAPHGPAA